jgi:tRNA(Ile)-lysidine synthase
MRLFVAAISGGADSVSLLLALHELKKLEKLNLRFVVAHFNHNLRGDESDADERFVVKIADEFGFELLWEKRNSV